MKSCIVFFTLLAFTVTAASASLTVPSASDIADESSLTEDTLKTAAMQFLKTMDSRSSVSTAVEKLLGAVASGESMQAISALQGLAKLDFSKEQLTSYGALLAQVVPLLLGSNFDLQQGELGQIIGKAIAFFQSENFASASDAISKALQYVDTDSLQHDLLSGIIASYAPMLENMDLNQAVKIGSSLLGNG